MDTAASGTVTTAISAVSIMSASALPSETRTPSSKNSCASLPTKKRVMVVHCPDFSITVLQSLPSIPKLSARSKHVLAPTLSNLSVVYRDLQQFQKNFAEFSVNSTANFKALCSKLTRVYGKVLSLKEMAESVLMTRLLSEKEGTRCSATLGSMEQQFCIQAHSALTQGARPWIGEVEQLTSRTVWEVPVTCFQESWEDAFTSLEDATASLSVASDKTATSKTLTSRSCTYDVKNCVLHQTKLFAEVAFKRYPIERRYDRLTGLQQQDCMKAFMVGIESFPDATAVLHKRMYQGMQCVFATTMKIVNALPHFLLHTKYFISKSSCQEENTEINTLQKKIGTISNELAEAMHQYVMQVKALFAVLMATIEYMEKTRLPFCRELELRLKTAKILWPQPLENIVTVMRKG